MFLFRLHDKINIFGFLISTVTINYRFFFPMETRAWKVKLQCVNATNKQKNQTKQNIALILKGITDLPGVILNA